MDECLSEIIPDMFAYLEFSHDKENIERRNFIIKKFINLYGMKLFIFSLNRYDISIDILYFNIHVLFQFFIIRF